MAVIAIDTKLIDHGGINSIENPRKDVITLREVVNKLRKRLSVLPKPFNPFQATWATLSASTIPSAEDLISLIFVSNDYLASLRFP